MSNDPVRDAIEATRAMTQQMIDNAAANNQNIAAGLTANNQAIQAVKASVDTAKTETNAKLDLIKSVNDGIKTASELTNTKLDLLVKVPNTGHKVTINAVGATPTKIPATPLANRIRMWVMNDAGTVIRVGELDVTITKGIEMKNSECREFVIGPGIQLWAIKASGSGSVVTEEFA